MRISVVLFIIIIVSEVFLTKVNAAANDDEKELRYSVILSEPLESTLDWDYESNDQTNVILQWNITLNNDYSGVLAFSKYDLNTDGLDVMIFGQDKKLYNGYTDETSALFIPENSVELRFKIVSEVSVNKGRKKKYSIRIIRPLNTCDPEKRNYIIDRGTVHLLTGKMNQADFKTIKGRDSIDIDVERLSLTLQRVQLLKSQVSTEWILALLFRILSTFRCVFHQCLINIRI